MEKTHTKPDDRDVKLMDSVSKACVAAINDGVPIVRVIGVLEVAKLSIHGGVERLKAEMKKTESN